MTIELSTIAFTDENDIVPVFGVEQIFNTGIANTFSGNDAITGTGDSFSTVLPFNGYPEGWPGLIPGIYNDIGGTINTGDEDDTITGISYGREGIIPDDYGDYGDGITNRGTIDTGNGNDIITGIGQGPKGVVGISSWEGDDSIINTGDGNDTIIGTATFVGINLAFSTLNTGEGNDIIAGTGGTIGLGNYDTTFNTGDGNDTITGHCNEYGVGIYNAGFINTGDGNDVINGIHGGLILAGIQNADGIINTGNGDDIITTSGLLDNYGTIDTGDGNDSIITEGGFVSTWGLGNMFLGEGDDYIKGFGTGDFYGGNGNDTLELTPGTYTVGIWDRVTFSKGNSLMLASEFEKLKAGSTIYDFTSLTAGQIIVVT